MYTKSYICTLWWNVLALSHTLQGKSLHTHLNSLRTIGKHLNSIQTCFLNSTHGPFSQPTVRGACNVCWTAAVVLAFGTTHPLKTKIIISTVTKLKDMHIYIKCKCLGPDQKLYKTMRNPCRQKKCLEFCISVYTILC